MSDAALTLLRTIEWLHATDWLKETPMALPSPVDTWLTETGSMTQRLERHCTQLTVVPYYNGYVAAEMLGDEQHELPDCARYWLREVIIYGDGQPWVAARTLIPPSALDTSVSALTTLGNTPLGRYLFKQNSLQRDYIHIGRCENLWARRSRLRLFNQPILLTELFLPSSPAYHFQGVDQGNR
ncbi:chorismate lyase [Candidatus Symbiopectobacterium sp. NZEC151]|uniref:chorismate lyase n=1 Tax=Candidatus Symbiopectobacterium sp. NZEC151 TaxID=2820470 RepID=UPI0022275399|nr:chorismate lyase [Candidatus Symbiopectobacterium sp. NZEC151]MCW2475349.1 chorismate lyase [Candidatus Symbiopectobacterium sp. NZEC151]